MLNYDQPPPRRRLLPAHWFCAAESFAREGEALANRLPWRYAGLVGDSVTNRGDVEACGSFLFHRQRADAPPLADWLGPFAARLELMSPALSAPVGSEAVEFAANWKILVENTLDDFHGSTVHPQTIHPAVDADWRQHLRSERHGPHSHSSWKLSADTAQWWEKLVARGGLARFATQDRYDHTFIFPDLYVASFHGAMVMVHRVVPLAVDQTRLEWRTFLPASNPGDRKGDAFRRSLAGQLALSARQVIEEDKPLCEMVQAGRAGATGTGILGWREQRIGDVHDALAALLDI